jgi:hypothetical protein
MKWNVMIASHPKFASRYYKATEYYQRIQEWLGEDDKLSIYR